MKRLIPSLFLLFIFILPGQTVKAQSNNNFKQQFLSHFNYTSRILSLAKAMPDDSYGWRPMEGAFSVAKVYMHIAHYNFLYPKSLGITVPQNVDLETIESITDKAKVVALLEQSIKHVKTAIQQMPASKLGEQTKLYGQTVNGRAVLLQLITHYSEHAGQAIAYARMNKIVPPWSR